MRRTVALQTVAAALMLEPRKQHWGYDLRRTSGVRSGVLYPILSRMLDAGWLSDGWEDATSIQDKRPPRRYYEITERGLRELGSLARAAQEQAGREPNRLRHRLAERVPAWVDPLWGAR